MRAATLAVVLALACRSEPARTAAGSSTPKDGSSAPARPAAITDEVVALLERLRTTFAPLVAEMHAVKSDCPKVVAVARSHHDRWASLANDAAPLARLMERDPEAARWIYGDISVRWKTMTEQMFAVAEACGNEPGFAEAMQVAPMLERPDP